MSRKRKSLQKRKKYVRVDHKTVIEVDKSKPDAKAIAEYIEKTNFSKPRYLGGKRKDDGS